VCSSDLDVNREHQEVGRQSEKSTNITDYYISACIHESSII
jgi:hypothetical protein